ncbi:hypothetical protein KC726_05430 [Candidatus Woesebacteria bacterium]|nr:hypothetical protein [Candidatus Woesebacteria bacterium]
MQNEFAWNNNDVPEGQQQNFTHLTYEGRPGNLPHIGSPEWEKRIVNLDVIPDEYKNFLVEQIRTRMRMRHEYKRGTFPLLLQNASIGEIIDLLEENLLKTFDYRNIQKIVSLADYQSDHKGRVIGSTGDGETYQVLAYYHDTPFDNPEAVGIGGRALRILGPSDKNNTNYNPPVYAEVYWTQTKDQLQIRQYDPNNPPHLLTEIALNSCPTTAAYSVNLTYIDADDSQRYLGDDQSQKIIANLLTDINGAMVKAF